MKQTVAVLFGGASTEYPVSLESASSVIRNLDGEKYNVILIGITQEGVWYRFRGDVSQIEDDTWHTSDSCTEAFLSPSRRFPGLVEVDASGLSYTKIDCVFPVLHGKNGEDGSVQGLLQLAGIPCVGCDMVCCAICMDKAAAHTIVQEMGIAVARSVTITAGDDLRAAVREAEKIGYPLFVKPVKSGSSIGITMAGSLEDLCAGIENAFRFDDRVVIEEAINGVEVGCAVLGNGLLTVGEVDEIELASGFFDYHEKYHLDTSQIHLPARADEKTRRRIQATAMQIYRALGCQGMARVDLFLTPDGQILFNEVNTIPGFTAHSRYPAMLRAVGIEFPELLDRLIQLSLEAKGCK